MYEYILEKERNTSVYIIPSKCHTFNLEHDPQLKENYELMRVTENGRYLTTCCINFTPEMMYNLAYNGNILSSGFIVILRRSESLADAWTLVRYTWLGW